MDIWFHHGRDPADNSLLPRNTAHSTGNDSRLARCHNSTEGSATSEAGLSADPCGQLEGDPVRVAFTPWLSVNARGSIKSNKLGIVDLGEISQVASVQGAS
jgi:hypothetical protein